MAVKVKSVTVTPQNATVGQTITITIVAEDSSWKTIKEDFLSWDSIKNFGSSWKKIFNHT